MKSEIINADQKELLIIGPLFETQKLSDLISYCHKNTILVFLGDLPGINNQEKLSSIENYQSFLAKQPFCYILGEQDLLLLKSIADTNFSAYNWLSTQHLALRFLFDNNTALLLIHGGLNTKYKSWNQMVNNLEIAFISNWHETYDGRFGYAISAHPHHPKSKQYRHSLQLATNQGQIFHKKGLGAKISF